MNTQFLRPTVKGRIERSAAYANVRISQRTGNPSIHRGRKSWGNINTIRGAETSAIIYSLVETAKANNLRVYDYMERTPVNGTAQACG